jgi:hypothetical protein
MDQEVYQHTTLTAAIADKSSPLRAYLDATYPLSRPVTDPHNITSPPILLSGHPKVNPGTLGTAFDLYLRLLYQPHTLPTQARFFTRWDPDLTDAWVDLLIIAAEEPEMREAAAWALAKAVEAYRAPVLPAAIVALLEAKGGYNAHDLLGIATADEVEQIAALGEIAREHLLPLIGTPDPITPPADAEEADFRRHVLAWAEPSRLTPRQGVRNGPVRRFGPTFVASSRCNADADLIQDGVLFEFKTTLGRVNSAGRRVDALTRAALLQLLGYALFDTNDENGIHTLALYSARYGRLTTWPLQEMLETLAGHNVDLATERQRVWSLLAPASHDVSEPPRRTPPVSDGV